MKPSDLGLPRDKFKAWQANQREAILAVACSDKRFIILNAPTGCVAGDTIITVARGTRLMANRKRSIETEFRNQSNPARLALPTFTRSVVGGHLGRNPIKGVVFSGPKLTYKLELADGKILRATPDHEILTTNGWVEMGSLTGRDRVLCDSDIIQATGRSAKKHYRSVQGLKYHPFAISFITSTTNHAGDPVGERVRGKIEYHRAVAEAAINDLSVDAFIRICRYDRESAAVLTFINPDEFHVHHADGNHRNNDPDNLEVLTVADHIRLHNPGHKFRVYPAEAAVKKLTKYQVEDTYDLVCEDPHRNFVANGIVAHNCGKSAIYMGVAGLLGGRTLILTMTKPLQRQLMDDFESMGMKVLQGQNNYPCRYFEDRGNDKRKLTCDEGPCRAGIDCQLRARGCDYYDAVRVAAKADIVVENYVHWMTLNRFSEPDTLGKFDNLILDEAHEANNALADFVRVVLDRHEFRRLLNLDLPSGASMEEWVEWATEEALPRARAKLEGARAATALHLDGIGTVKEIAELEGHLADLSRARSWKQTDAADPAVWTPGTSSDWVVEEEDEKVTFQPVWASGYAEDYIFRFIPKVVLVSATVTPRDAFYMGVFRSQLDYLQYPSPFHRSKRPLIVIPTVGVKRGMTDGEIKIWINQIDRILELEAEERGLKGIIHAVSYERAKLIKERSRFSHLMVIHDRRNLRTTVEAFKASKGPAVLISPSVGTGYDFPGDQCRFIILAKIPFIDNRPKVIKARMKLDKEYLNHVAFVSLIQMVGRGVRSADDSCRSYLIDDNWRWFSMATNKMMPKWFKSAIRKVKRFSEVE